MFNNINRSADSAEKFQYIQGDQFVGFNVNPKTGDLLLRYVVVRTDIPDANGRGLSNYFMETNREAVKGRPIIFAPDQTQGGRRGHTDFMTTDPYRFEIARVLNMEKSSANLFERMKKKLVQTNSSYNDLLKNEDNLWVVDAIVTNENAKKIMLDPATSHLIPRYISISTIHSRQKNGDYRKVDDGVIDHFAIVKKPQFDNTGKQIEGAAYGEITRLRGACFSNDRLSCLDYLQTSSSVKTLDKCVSCPDMLKTRLTDLYIDLRNNGYITQSSSSSNNMSENTTTTTTNTTVSASTDGSTDNNVVVQTNKNPLNSFDQQTFQSDNKLQDSYNQFTNLFKQAIQENKAWFKSQLIDSDKNEFENQNPNAEKVNSEQNQQQQQQTSGQSTDQQQASTGQLKKEDILKVLDLKEDDIRKLSPNELKGRLDEFKTNISKMMDEHARNTRILNGLNERDQKTKIANLLPQEAFYHNGKFLDVEFQSVVNDIHKMKMSDEYIKVLSAGFIGLRNQQNALNEQKDKTSIADKKWRFGDSLKYQQQQQKQQDNQTGQQPNNQVPNIPNPNQNTFIPSLLLGNKKETPSTPTLTQQ